MTKYSAYYSIFLFLFFTLLFSQKAYTAPACPRGSIHTQPNGSTIELFLRGDEFLHWTETGDGVIVTRINNKEYQYAQVDSLGRVSPSGVLANSLPTRSSAEKAHISKLNQQQFFTAKRMDVRMQFQSRQDSSYSNSIKTRASTNPKYLIILVEFSDVFFQKENSLNTYKQLMNDINFPSARKYFNDNSMGAFNPEFTIAGPVRLNKPYSYYGENNSSGDDKYASTMVREACAALSSSINFAEYDTNNDGYVDNIYIIFAGYSENYANTDPKTIWPHQSYLSSRGDTPTYNNKSINKYACSGELINSAGNVRDGIGTFCHEFSHILGLQDMYDTDNDKSGGESYHMNQYSIMALGPYLNNGNTPSAYTAFEREMLKWGTAEELKEGGTKKLTNLGTSNHFFRINTSNPNEYFLLENRQQTGWDQYLAGHGLLIYHIDKSNLDVYKENKINTNPLHQYVDIEEADNIRIQNNRSSYQGDPFPGTSNNRSFTDETLPSMRLWNNTPVGKPIYNIQEIDGIIYFDFMNQISVQIPEIDKIEQILENSLTISWKRSPLADRYEIEASKLITEQPHEDLEYGFDNYPLLPLNWSAENIESYTYSFSNYFGLMAPALKFSSSTSVLTTSSYDRPISQFAFTAIGSGVGSSDSYLNINGLKGNSWVNIGTLKNSADAVRQTVNIDKKTIPSLPDSIMALRFSYQKVRGNLSFDDLKIRVGEEGSIVMDGYNGKDVGNVLSTTVSGLTPNTNYSFRVRSINGVIKSSYSSPIIAKTLNTSSIGNLANKDHIRISYQNHSLLIYNPIGDLTANIYSLSGELLLQQNIIDGENLIPFNKPGFYIVCIGELRYKIVIM